MVLKFKLEIDHANNPRVISTLMYYISCHTQNYDPDKNTNFIFDDTIPVADKPTIFIIPKEDVDFKYQDKDIRISYRKTRESLVCHTSEIRFDQITVSSDTSIQHILDFMYMISKDWVIPDSSGSELERYVWNQERCRWTYNKTFKRRKLETIYYHKKNHVVEELNKFLTDEKTEKFYEKLDIPYKKIFLLYGIPGTGKTSFIRALASAHDYKLCIVKNIKDIDDSGIENMFNFIIPKSFLVFEDIDSMFVGRESKTKGNFITFSGILNALDGIASYSKLVVFITTNFIQQIDSAIKRRVDVAMEFTYLQKSEIMTMIKQFFPDKNNEFGEKFYEMVSHKKLTANTLEKFFVRCIQHDKNIYQNIKELDTYTSFSSGDAPPDCMYT